MPTATMYKGTSKPSLLGSSQRRRKSTRVSSLQDAVNNLLNVREQAEFRQIINDYNIRRNLVDLSHSLAVLLDTPAKRQLVKTMKSMFSKTDGDRFSELMTQHLNNKNAGTALWESKISPTDGQLQGYDTLGRPGAGQSQGYATLDRPKPIKTQGYSTLDHPRPNQGQGYSTLDHPRPNQTQGYSTLDRPRTSQAPNPSSVSGSLSALHLSTLPRKPTRIIKRPMAHTDFLGSGRSSIPDLQPPVTLHSTRQIQMTASPDPNVGLGFSIRGGAEHGIGIYVSYVDVGSTADRSGLTPGDLILSVNGTSFKRITHDEAAKVVKTAQHSLTLDVRHVGRVPGSFESHQTYTWVDPDGKPVEPPDEVDRAGRYVTQGTRKSGLMLLKESDERKVNLFVKEQKSLGISIRGGNEFGLGVYITLVDRGSAAGNAGLKVGDQILDVNGVSFLDVSHSDAVLCLTSSKHLMMTVKDVGRLPYARTTHDHTQWITGGARHTRADTHSSMSEGHMSPFASSRDVQPMFSRGAGSQLMHHSMVQQASQLALLEKCAGRQLLTDRERVSLSYYLEEYRRGYVTVEALAMALFELLNTRDKFGLMADVRAVIFPKDLRIYDNLVVQNEVHMLKSKSMDNLLMVSDDHDNGYQGNSSFDLGSISTNSQLDSTVPSRHDMESGEEMTALREAIELLEKDRLKEMKDTSTKRKSKLKAALGSLRRRKKSSASDHKQQIKAEIHPNPMERLMLKDEKRSPSEDSGVDMTHYRSRSSPTAVHHNNHSSEDSLTTFPDSHGAPTAYSLMQTGSVGDSDGPDDTFLSSLSQFEESLNRKMDMFKMLPAQSESELVHVNIQTDGDWPQGQTTRGRSATKSPYGMRSQSLDRSRHQTLRVHSDTTQLSPRSQDIILTTPDSNHGNRPPKPPRTPSTKRGNRFPQFQQQNGYTTSEFPNHTTNPHQLTDINLDSNDLQLSYNERHHGSNGPRFGSKNNFPQNGNNGLRNSSSDLHLGNNDFPFGSNEQLHTGNRDIQSGNNDSNDLQKPSSNTQRRRYLKKKQSTGALKNSLSRAVSTPNICVSEPEPDTRDTTPGLMEPLLIIPPPPPSGLTTNYHMPDVPLDQSLDYLTNGIPSPGESFHGNSLSAIEIVPPPPPLDLDFTSDLDLSGEETRDSYGNRDVPSHHGNTHQNGHGYHEDNNSRELRIVKSRPNLGIAIEGGANTRQPLPRIINIQPGGAAALCKELHIGDIITHVDGRGLDGLPHRQCAKTIAEAFKDGSRNILCLSVIKMS